jgi:hypothetical protein
MGMRNAVLFVLLLWVAGVQAENPASTKGANQPKARSGQHQTAPDEKLVTDKQIAEYTRQLAIYTKDLAAYTEKRAWLNLFLVLVTVGLVVAGIYQGVQMRASVKDARKAFLSSHRPKMRIRHVWLAERIEAGKPIMVNVVSANTGDTAPRVIEFNVQSVAAEIPYCRPYKTACWISFPLITTD